MKRMIRRRGGKQGVSAGGMSWDGNKFGLEIERMGFEQGLCVGGIGGDGCKGGLEMRMNIRDGNRD